METIKQFLLSLRFIFMPHYWIMNERYNKKWDIKLNELLDQYEFTNINYNSITKSFTRAELGNQLIWIENYPYDCFRPYGSYHFRASRNTIYKAKKKLDKVIKEINKNKIKVDPYDLFF